MTSGASAQVKICGLSTAEAVHSALLGGASLIGFVFFARSPRNVTPEAAARLAEPARARGVKVVAVTVDATDAELDAIAGALRPDFIQLHGRETPGRAREIKARTGSGAIKAIPVAEASDLAAARDFDGVADHLMFDAKAPAGAALPGGNGAAFDWDILKGLRLQRPWLLAGGLDPWNVGEAVRRSGAPMLDVSSGVERGAGLKDPALIAAFLDAVRKPDASPERPPS
jgi:phosphoribosylanthranilate isomerase